MPWMTHTAVPAGMAAFIAPDAQAFWASKGWTVTTAPTVHPPVPPARIPLTTMASAALGGKTIQVPSDSVAFWVTKGWA